MPQTQIQNQVDLEVQTSAPRFPPEPWPAGGWRDGPRPPFPMSTSWGPCPLRIQPHPLSLASQLGSHRPPSAAAHQAPTANRQGGQIGDILWTCPLSTTTGVRDKAFLLLRSLQTPEAFTTCCPTTLQTLSHPAPGCSQEEPQRASTLSLPHAAHTGHTWSPWWVRLPIPHLAGEDPEAQGGEDLLSSHLQRRGGSPSARPVRRTL